MVRYEDEDIVLIGKSLVLKGTVEALNNENYSQYIKLEESNIELYSTLVNKLPRSIFTKYKLNETDLDKFEGKVPKVIMEVYLAPKVGTPNLDYPADLSDSKLVETLTGDLEIKYEEYRFTNEVTRVKSLITVGNTNIYNVFKKLNNKYVYVVLTF